MAVPRFCRWAVVCLVVVVSLLFVLVGVGYAQTDTPDPTETPWPTMTAPPATATPTPVPTVPGLPGATATSASGGGWDGPVEFDPGGDFNPGSIVQCGHSVCNDSGIARRCPCEVRCSTSGNVVELEAVPRATPSPSVTPSPSATPEGFDPTVTPTPEPEVWLGDEQVTVPTYWDYWYRASWCWVSEDHQEAWLFYVPPDTHEDNAVMGCDHESCEYGCRSHNTSNAIPPGEWRCIWQLDGDSSAQSACITACGLVDGTCGVSGQTFLETIQEEGTGNWINWKVSPNGVPASVKFRPVYYGQEPSEPTPTPTPDLADCVIEQEVNVSADNEGLAVSRISADDCPPEGCLGFNFESEDTIVMGSQLGSEVISGERVFGYDVMYELSGSCESERHSLAHAILVPGGGDGGGGDGGGEWITDTGDVDRPDPIGIDVQEGECHVLVPTINNPFSGAFGGDLAFPGMQVCLNMVSPSVDLPFVGDPFEYVAPFVMALAGLLIYRMLRVN